MKIRKELIFGFTLMALIIGATAYAMPWPWNWQQGHFGLFMLSMVVVAIMLGFPTAFTLMGMGVLFAFIAYRLGRRGPRSRSSRRSISWCSGPTRS